MSLPVKILIITLVVLLGAGAALFLAVRLNGPAVLDTVDRVTGGDRDVALVGRESYGTDPAQRLYIYEPEDRTGPLPLLVFVHGGSWSSGDPAYYGFVARALAARGFVVVLAGYRLGEEGRYPAMLQDTAAAIAEAVRLAPGYDADPTRIVLAGHSAGAYNVVQAVLDPQWLAAAGVDPSHIRGVIGMSGPYDFYPFDRPSGQAAFGSVGAGPESQPINHPRGDAPPMLLIHGEADELVKPRNTRVLARAIGEAGGQVETLFLPEDDHTAPLIALASPWRGRRPVADRMAQFAQRVTEVSVPVQAETP